jgi:3'-phosphoadenosine 5'-phosphosulfate sulfotransferase (PAPS reductase)/FAD synthetase
MTSPCFSPDRSHTEDDLRKSKSLSLDAKVLLSKATIQKFHAHMRGKIYVSFSGGRDSTVLLHIARELYPDIPAVFYNTGMEFPEIYDFIREQKNVTTVNPKMSFRKVIAEYGYPVGGKNLAHWVDLAQRGHPSGIKQMNAETKYGYKSYKWMVDAPFKISDKCCYKLKKEPAALYHKETGRAPLIGSRNEESNLRTEMWMKHGEISTAGVPSCTPLSLWTAEDVTEYIRRNDIKLSEIYNMGYDRTGCTFCLFGIFLDRGRFLKLKHTHPKAWAYCMRPIEDGGLGMEPVLDFIGVPSGKNQASLKDFEEGT